MKNTPLLRMSGPGRAHSRATIFCSLGLARYLLGPLLFTGHALAAPSGGTVAAGSGDIASQGTTTTITQHTEQLSLNWTTFDIGAQETVRFNQPSASSIAVNRIADPSGSRIHGVLQAHGKVFLINPRGVLFGPSAQVNVGGLVASTLDTADNLTFSAVAGSTGAVRNQGSLTAANGGYVALLGATVSNTGTITVPGGTAALGAGSRVTLDFAGDRLWGLSVSENTVAAEAANGGLIRADGGRVLLSAGARQSLVASAVNNTGVIEARSFENRDGTIILLGGMTAGRTSVAGTLDASAPSGGDGGIIETSAAQVNVADDAIVTTRAATGRNGLWLIDPLDYVIAPGGGNQTGAQLSASLGSGNVLIVNPAGSGNGDILVNDSVAWSANTLTLRAHRDIVINAPMTGTGTARLALEYGQGAVALNNTADYHIKAPVSLPAGLFNQAGGPNFSTKLGSDGITLNYTVITSLGAAGSTTAADLQGINGGLGGNYAIGANIDASATSGWTSLAYDGFNRIGINTGAFEGRLTGLGHTISGLYSRRIGGSFNGLFGYVDGGTIRDLGLVSVDIRGASDVGALAGFMDSAVVRDVYVTGVVFGFNDRVGGLVGQSQSSTIADTYSTASVTGKNSVGGLVGYSNTDTITRAYSAGAVAVTTPTPNSNIGGFVGWTAGSTINTAYSTGAVNGGSGGTAVGGFVGFNTSTDITHAYSTGAVSGSNQVGGFVGLTGFGGTISNAYSAGLVTSSGADVGGFAGLNVGATIASSYWDVTTSGRATSAGVGAS